MEDWMYGLIAIPVIAAGAGYAYYASSSKAPQPAVRDTAFSGDSYDFGESYQGSAGRRRKTSKGKSNNKKTKRRR